MKMPKGRREFKQSISHRRKSYYMKKKFSGENSEHPNFLSV